jgi:hypothetical protein
LHEHVGSCCCYALSCGPFRLLLSIQMPGQRAPPSRQPRLHLLLILPLLPVLRCNPVLNGSAQVPIVH